jgi:hypothetical protein
MRTCNFCYGVFHLRHKMIALWESKCCILICLTLVIYIVYDNMPYSKLCIREVCLNGAFLKLYVVEAKKIKDRKN